MEEIKTLKWIVVVFILLIIILTILEFPAPIGFETRPQENVSMFWLAFFIIILVVEIASISLLFKHPKIGGVLGILAAILNILQVLSDQLHLMQPEVAPIGYRLLEYSVVLVSIVLAYFSYKLINKI
jgi:hypothetical protein